MKFLDLKRLNCVKFYEVAAALSFKDYNPLGKSSFKMFFF
jgi:hypothetical protein